ncbi:MetQ/NlpA family ABC transporter substrate-binding protein [Paenibacillus tarimensis]|uniref:MetQ/NlpA family ABC transporter substrate-binding protein n=1 Tax=Paenibacillus tarimensis TaxID=416012 RepID=UPI001F2739C8|nr:MetQ/NlpA family ABC transporter substrate-binding protein [Paenibacillus tarimensis]MCF2946311.1 MetQ/NlpA family ABC transporter substrate-binding protein [Paenibacillus tarimensis]
MKKSIVLLFTIVMAFTLAACGAGGKDSNTGNAGAGNTGAGTNQGTAEPAPATPDAEPVKLSVAATPVPHAEILNFVKDSLLEQGVELEVVEFTDYVQPNVQVYEKQLDANFFQHVPYLEQFNSEKGYDLVKVNGVHIEPIGAYSNKIKSLDELTDGAKVAIPNDATNGGRSLLLFAANGLITLKDGIGVEATIADIVDNPKNLEFVELEAATLPRVLDEVALAAINTNYALEAGLMPTEDAIIIEDSNSPYVNILAARPDNKDSEAIQKLAAALNTEEVRQFIEEKYKGAVVPAFE